MASKKRERRKDNKRDELSLREVPPPPAPVYPRFRTNIYLDLDQLEKLKEVSHRTGAPVAEIVRRAVNGYLKRLSEIEGGNW